MLKFMLLVGKLKRTARTGWVDNRVKDCESVAEHQWRMSLMAMTLCPVDIRERCISMAIVHDLAEALTGDITPEEYSGVTAAQKRELEAAAMQTIRATADAKNAPDVQRIVDLWEEYDAGQTFAAKFVKQLDKLEMLLQAFEVKNSVYRSVYRSVCLSPDCLFVCPRVCSYACELILCLRCCVICKRDSTSKSKDCTCKSSLIGCSHPKRSMSPFWWPCWMNCVLSGLTKSLLVRCHRVH
jgi:5'-deoxynucleotidase YfbR-like HD superfamily hydrolase